MNNNTKRKSRTNANSLPFRATRNKPTGPVDRTVIDGVYNNARFMHAATSLVGCIVQVLTASGTTYEGIFRTFSQQFDIVLELAHKIDRGQPKLPSKDGIIDKLIIRTPDVVHLTATNADTEYATKDTFATDAAISKFNGQVSERELEPWEGASAEGEDLPSLDTENANGWDVNDMFRTNEQQYGVQSTFDQSLAGYTIPLQKKNTDEFKKQEAKASRIATEIESSPSYRARIAVENGDEEERFSAVIRPDNSSMVGNWSVCDRYVPPAKRKNPQSGKLTRTSSSPQQNSHAAMAVKSHTPPGHPQPPQGHPGMMSSPANAAGPPHIVHNIPHGQPPPPLVQHPQTGIPHPQSHYGPPQQQPAPMSSVAALPHPAQPPPHHVVQQSIKLVGVGESAKIVDESKINGEKLDKEDKKLGPTSDSPVNESRDGDGKVPVCDAPPTAHISNKLDRKNLNPKARDEQMAELKQFSSDFQLSAENNDDGKKQEQIESKEKGDAEMDKVSSTLKHSTLNPNAKEFNPQQKQTYARSPNTQTPTPPRPHTPSTVMAQPQAMPIISQSQPIFTGLPTQYMMPAPVSVSLNHSFNPATMQQAPRLRKGGWVPTSVHQQRHEFSQVAAATGQPLLAPASLPGHHFVQYAPQNMVPGQTTMYHPQVYSLVGPRMVAPQHISMVPTSHAGSYGDNQHVPNQVFVSAHPMPPGPNHQHHGATSLQSMSQGPHSNPPGSQQGPPMAGQSQAAGVHPSPSPVHQPPPQQPTPPATVGSQQPLVYQPPHAGQLGQPPLQHSPHTPNSPQNMHPNQSNNPLGHPNAHLHPNAVSHSASNAHGGGPHMTQAHPHQGPAGYQTVPGPPQQMHLILQQAPTTALTAHPQQVPPGGPTAYQGQLHGPGNPGQVAHIMSHSSMPVMPATSGAATMPTHPQIHYIHQHHGFVAASQSPLQPYAHAQ